MSRAPRDLRNLVAESQRQNRASVYEDDDSMLIQTLQQKLDAQRRELENRTDSISSIQRNFESLSSLYSEERQRIAQLERENRQKEERIKLLEEDVLKLRNAEKKGDELRDRVAALETLCRNKDIELEGAGKTVSAMRTQIDCLHELLQTDANEMRNLENAAMDLRSRLEKANDMVAQLQQRLEASLKQQSADKEMFDQIRHEWERDAEIQNLRLQEATQRDAQQRISDLKAVLERERAESAQKFASQVREHQDQLSSLRSSHESALRKCRMECDDAMRQLLMEKDAEILALQKTLERFQLSSNEDVTRFQRLEREWATKLSLKETEIRHLVSQIEEERMLRSQEASRSHGELKEREARLQALVEQERLHAELQRQAFEDWKSEASRASDETLKCALDAQQRLFADEVSQLRTSLSGSLKDREELEAQFRKVLNDAIALEQKKSKTMLEDAEVRFLALQREQERWAAAYHDAMHAQEHTESTLSQLKKTSDLQLSELRTKVLFLEKEISLLVEQQKQAVTSKEIASVATELKRTVARMQAADDASDTAFTCMECMNILHDPVTYYPCGHTFCLKCAGDRREGKGKYPCQECSTLVTGIAKNYAVDQLLGKREFRKQAVSSLAELSSKLLQDTERTSQ